MENMKKKVDDYIENSESQTEELLHEQTIKIQTDSMKKKIKKGQQEK